MTLAASSLDTRFDFKRGLVGINHYNLDAASKLPKPDYGSILLAAIVGSFASGIGTTAISGDSRAVVYAYLAMMSLAACGDSSLGSLRCISEVLCGP